MPSADVQLQIAGARRILAREGCESGIAGHVSVRAEDGSGFWINGMEYFEETVPEGVVKLDFECQMLVGTGDCAPAVEFHAKIYQARPDVNSIVHTHAHFTKVLAATGTLLGMYHDESGLFLDEQVIHYDDGMDLPVQGRVLAETAGDKHVVILNNHGAVFLGETLQNATVEAFLFEECARIQYETLQIGGREHTREYALRAKAAGRKYVVPGVWDAQWRWLHREVPELFAARTANAA
jgi:L-fuculose-phosphate aldolase